MASSRDRLSYPLYTLPEIDNLNSLCPHIAHLALNVDIGRSMPYDVLHALGRFAELSALRLYLSFAGAGISGNPHFTIDLLSVTHMFSYISNRKVGQRFERLEVMMDDNGQGEGNIMFNDRDQIGNERPRMFFVCYKYEDGNVKLEEDVIGDKATLSLSDSYFKDENSKSSSGDFRQEEIRDSMGLEETAEPKAR